MSKNNPLLVTGGLPQFDLIKPEHVVPGVRHVLAEVAKQVKALEENLDPTWAGLLRPLEEMDLPFEYAWGPVGHLLGVKNADALRKVHEEVLPEVVAFSLRMQQSRTIYEGLRAIRNGPEWEKLDTGQKRVVELKLRAAEHAGVGLETEAKERFNEIARELSQIGTDFSNHVLDATKAYALILTDSDAADGWPQSFRQVAAQSYNQVKKETDPEGTPKDGPWRVTLDYPSFGPFMQHHRRRKEREQVYRAYVTRASKGELDNSALIEQTLKLRKEQAGLLGFETYAELSLDSKMAQDAEAVEKMFDELFAASKSYMQKDYGEIVELAQEGGQTEPLAHWDMAFWSERLQEQRFDYTDDQLRPYFPLPRVLDGLFGLSEKLFDIQIQRTEGNEAPVWNTDVQYFKVYGENGEQIASFYLDPYSRPEEKRGGAWMDQCLNRRWLDGKLRLPVAHLCCNGTPPVGDRPSLMSFSEVTTLFHEFGHGLQEILTTVDYADVAGVNGVEWDAVEIASQFMENWCYHKETLLGMTSHVDTGESLPEDLFDKICSARTFCAGSLMMRQLGFGMTDLQLYHNHEPGGEESAFEVNRRVTEETSMLPPLPEDRFLCSFSHIFAGGYAAGYYSYKWSEVLSADAFSAFEEAGLEDEGTVKEIGRRFRDTILAQGGSRDPMDVFKDFRGRQPSTEALLRHSGLLEKLN